MSSGKRVSKSPSISEAHIERTCTDWLALDGWRHLKTDPVSRREWGKGFGELGMADGLYIRYRRISLDQITLEPLVELTWIEWKSKRGKAKQHQKDWHAAERARGALTLIAGEDFPKTIEGFQAWYRVSGLMRRNLR